MTPELWRLVDKASREEMQEIKESFKLGPKLRAKRDAAAVIGRAQRARQRKHTIHAAHVKLILAMWLRDHPSPVGELTP